MLKRKCKISVPLAAVPTAFDFTPNIVKAKSHRPLPANPAATPVCQHVESPQAVVEDNHLLSSVSSVNGATAGKRRRLLVLPGMPAAAKRPLTASVVTDLDPCSGRDIALPWRVQQQGGVGLAAAKSPKRIHSVDTAYGRNQISTKSTSSSGSPMRMPVSTSPAIPPPAGVDPHLTLQPGLCQGLGLGPLRNPQIGSSQPGVGKMTAAKGIEQGEKGLQTAPAEMTQGLCELRYDLPSTCLIAHTPPLPNFLNGGDDSRVAKEGSEKNMDMSCNGAMHVTPMTAHEAPQMAASGDGATIADQAVGSPQSSDLQKAAGDDASTFKPTAVSCEHRAVLSPRVGHTGVNGKASKTEMVTSARDETPTSTDSDISPTDAQALQGTDVKTPKPRSHVQGKGNPKTPTTLVAKQCQTAGGGVPKTGEVSSLPPSPLLQPNVPLLSPPLPSPSLPLALLRSLPRLPAVKSSELPMLDVARNGLSLPGAAHLIGRLAKVEELSMVPRIATAASARLLAQSLMPRKLPPPALPLRTDLAVADLSTAVLSLGSTSFLGGTAGPEGRLTPVQEANQECKREENVSLNTIADVGAGRQGSDQGLWQRHEETAIHQNPTTSATSAQDFGASFDDVAISTTMLQAMCA